MPFKPRNKLTRPSHVLSSQDIPFSTRIYCIIYSNIYVLIADCVDQKGVMRHYGDRWYEDDCKLCECLNTNATHCIRIPERCPQVKPGCVEIEVEDQCCPDIECDSDGNILIPLPHLFAVNSLAKNFPNFKLQYCPKCSRQSLQIYLVISLLYRVS